MKSWFETDKIEIPADLAGIFLLVRPLKIGHNYKNLVNTL